uniref:Uncharacterized protein n=1 Tax=Amphimedon queenslandica TaxID=400682 RepID=A0A1X7UED7_AMPQE
MQDIHDGSVIKDLMNDDQFLYILGNKGLVLCSDGVPVYKSSKGRLWPFYLMVTSIPPQKSLTADNLIVATSWHGPTEASVDNRYNTSTGSRQYLYP